MDWWTELGLATSSFLDRHGLLAAFVFLLIEEAGVPVPVPGDVLMLILGVHARQGAVPLWQAVLATWSGTLIGSTLLYFAARKAGRSMVYRYGRFIRLTPERLDRTEQWLNQHGSRAVFLGRLVPGLRILTAVACGVFEVPFRVFFPAMSLGALLYILVYTLLGYFLGPPVLALLEKVHVPLGLLGSLVPLALILVWTVRARQVLDGQTRAAPVEHEQRLRAGAMAGALATIGSTLLFNVGINFAGDLAFQTPGTLVERSAARLAFAVARDAAPVQLFVAVLGFMAVGVIWGAIYGLWGARLLPAGWPDWLAGLVYAGLPFAVSALVAMPLLGLGLLGVGATGPVAITGELIRHAAYGVLLGWLYPVFEARRLVKVVAPTVQEVPPERMAPAGAD